MVIKAKKVMKGTRYLESSKVQVRNQVVVPKEAADRLKLKGGDLLGFYEVEGNPDIIVIAKVKVVSAIDDRI